MSFMFGTAARAADKKVESKVNSKSSMDQGRLRNAPLKSRVILVQVTGSWIPQRVVVKGQQVNSASPLWVVQGTELLRSGSTSVEGILAMDPSITFTRRH